jgi:CRP-like cAMP-binding protein
MSVFEMLRDDPNAESFAAGSFIFEEGTPGDVMYVVQEGTVEIRHKGKLLAAVEPGGVFGEMALIDNEPRSATAAARTGCRVVPVDRKRFTFLIQQTPYFALEVMRVLADRLRRMND